MLALSTHPFPIKALFFFSFSFYNLYHSVCSLLRHELLFLGYTPQTATSFKHWYNLPTVAPAEPTGGTAGQGRAGEGRARPGRAGAGRARPGRVEPGRARLSPPGGAARVTRSGCARPRPKRDPRGATEQHGPARRSWGRSGLDGRRAQLRAVEEEIHAADEEAAAAAQGEEAARVAGGAGEHRPPGAALPRGTAGQRGAMEKRFLSSCVDRTGRRRRDGVCVWVLDRGGELP